MPARLCTRRALRTRLSRGGAPLHHGGRGKRVRGHRAFGRRRNRARDGHRIAPGERRAWNGAGRHRGDVHYRKSAATRRPARHGVSREPRSRAAARHGAVVRAR